MNSTFDFSRWGLLVRQHWIENKKRYLLSMGAMAGILFMWFFWLSIVEDKTPMDMMTQKASYFFLLFVSGCFYASQFFRELGSRSRGINYLLLPASALEKLLVGLLYAIVLFFTFFTGIYYLVDVIMVTAVNAIHPAYTIPDANGVIQKTSVANVFGWFGIENGAPFFLSGYFAVQAAFLLGSVYFEKYSFVKTVISLFFIVLVMFMINEYLLEPILPEGSFVKDIGSFRVFNEKEGSDFLVELPVAVRNVITSLVQYGFPFLFWVVTYFRLKEKEV